MTADLARRLAAGPAHFPHSLDLATDRLLLIETTEAELSAASFLDQRLITPATKGAWAAMADVVATDPSAMERSSKIMLDAMYRNEEFRNYAFPKVVAPPLITTYHKAMRYGLHADAAFMPIGQRPLRADLSCTLFLSDPDSYEGGALRVVLGSREVLFRLRAGSLVLYPSTTLHEVTPVTSGERRVGLTFIESRIADAERREWLYELNEVAALEGLGMERENFMRLQRIQQNQLRHWSDPG